MDLLDDDDDEGGGGDAAWMATFADLMSLLLTFFVLLLSFANMDIVRFRVVLGSVRDAFGVQFEHPGEVEAVSTSIVELSKQESTEVVAVIEEIALLKKVKKYIKKEGLEGLMEAELGERGVVIRIKGQVLFGSGDDHLSEKAPGALEPIVQLTKAMPYQLSIEGHTDDRPIDTTRFPSNWELSTARATATMRYLVDKGLDPARVNVAGYAHMRPVGDNDTEEGRSMNRRVEFVFLRPADSKTKYSQEELEAAKRGLDEMNGEPDVVSGDVLPTAPGEAESGGVAEDSDSADSEGSRPQETESEKVSPESSRGDGEELEGSGSGEETEGASGDGDEETGGAEAGSTTPDPKAESSDPESRE